MDTEGEPPIPETPEPPTPAPPPKPEIKIRDLTRQPTCAVCGKEKTPYIEVEVDGVVEYTCKECYEGQAIEIAACRKCGAALAPEDHFCGKCGTPRALTCRSCGADLDEEDRFCGKCGTKIG